MKTPWPKVKSEKEEREEKKKEKEGELKEKEKKEGKPKNKLNGVTEGLEKKGLGFLEKAFGNLFK